MIAVCVCFVLALMWIGSSDDNMEHQDTPLSRAQPPSSTAPRSKGSVRPPSPFKTTTSATPGEEGVEWDTFRAHPELDTDLVWSLFRYESVEMMTRCVQLWDLSIADLNALSGGVVQLQSVHQDGEVYLGTNISAPPEAGPLSDNQEAYLDCMESEFETFRFAASSDEFQHEQRWIFEFTR